MVIFLLMVDDFCAARFLKEAEALEDLATAQFRQSEWNKHVDSIPKKERKPWHVKRMA